MASESFPLFALGVSCSKIKGSPTVVTHGHPSLMTENGIVQRYPCLVHFKPSSSFTIDLHKNHS